MRAHIDDGNARGIFLGPGRSPVVYGVADALAFGYLAVTDNGDDKLILADDSLVGDPVVFGLPVDRPQVR